VKFIGKFDLNSFHWRGTFMIKKAFFWCLSLTSVVGYSADRDDNSTYSTENPEYKVPQTPELYDASKPKGMPVTFPSAATFGGFVSFGQSRSSKSEDNPKVAWMTGGSFTYLKGTSTWNRVDFGGDVFTGSVGHSNADVPINIGFLAHFGYGYSLGGELFGTLQIGAGLANVGYKGETEQNQKFEMSESKGATVLQIGWHLAMPIGSNVGFTAGIDYTKMDFTVDDVDLVDNGVKRVFELDKRESLTIPSLQLGVRFLM
jgi:hypothetical protein